MGDWRYRYPMHEKNVRAIKRGRKTASFLKIFLDVLISSRTCGRTKRLCCSFWRNANSGARWPRTPWSCHASRRLVPRFHVATTSRMPRMATGARSLAKLPIVNFRGRLLDRLLLLEETSSEQRPANRDRGGNTQAQQRRRSSAADALSERRRCRDEETNRS
jgi:hypothetical protein